MGGSGKKRRLPLLRRIVGRKATAGEAAAGEAADREAVGRRGFAALLAGGAAALHQGVARGEVAEDMMESLEHEMVIPPVDAKAYTSACAFCIVGCGYRVFTWPVGTSGGIAAADNALGVDFPAGVFGRVVTPNMHNVVDIDGEPHHIIVMPDNEAEVVNLDGDHSLGGTLARRLYSPYTTATADRLLEPQLRIGDRHYPIPWDDALRIMAEVGNHVLDEHGPLAWGMKTYSYQFYENTYAITKLAFDAVGTPCWAPHDQPRDGSSTPGLSDAGLNAFSASYEDWYQADVIFVSGVSLYAAKAVLFSQWVQRGGAKLVVVNPRRDTTADYAEANGGLFLQVNPGTDTVLNNAIARVILEEGWQDAEFIEQFVVGSEQELQTEHDSSWRRARFGMTFDQWAEFILGDDTYTPESAEAITGVSAELIREAARMMAAPGDDGERPRTSMMLEKGNYWSHNYPNSASLVSLGLLVGAGNRPGRVISRGGGHQRGMIKAAGYPTDLSPDEVDGNKIPLNVDRWLLEGNLRFVWAIGCTWAGGGTAAASLLYSAIEQLTHHTGPQLSLDEAFPDGTDGALDVDAVIGSLIARTEAGGTVLAQQDIYLQDLSALADLVLPAVSWGEGTFTRMQGERRLRLYPQVVDAPGQSRPDWWIVAQVAQRMGFDGFDWADGDEIFVEAAERTAGNSNDYVALVEHAAELGVEPRALLGQLGTTGIQCPAKREGGELVGTVRLHDADAGRSFGTATGKALLVRGDWQDVQARQAELAPRDEQLWVINRRDSRTWSGMIEDRRIPFRMDQMPDNVLEMSAEDAAARGIADGDPVMVFADAMSGSEHSVASVVLPRFYARAEVSDRLRPGVTCAYFNYLGQQRFAANNVVSSTTDEINGMYSFKLGRGWIVKDEGLSEGAI